MLQINRQIILVSGKRFTRNVYNVYANEDNRQVGECFVRNSRLLVVKVSQNIWIPREEDKVL
jgi:hypothetical protein